MKRLWMWLALCVSALAGQTETLPGRWDAELSLHDSVIPFRIDFSSENGAFTASLFNGEIPVTPTRATFTNGLVILNFEQLMVKLTAHEEDGRLEGRIEGRFADAGGAQFRATRHLSPAGPSSAAPSIAGIWVIPHETGKGEKAWRFIVRQSGADVSASILRVDGDTGTLTGAWQDGRFVLSHFDGTRPALMIVKTAADGALAIDQPLSKDARQLTAYRLEDARAKGLPEPADFSTHTTMRDPRERFTFRFADADGRIWSESDPKFKNKVLIVNVTGTWCPNCHDEAPYLEQLYRDYRESGFEIVALDFEEPEQQAQLERARAFIRKYGIEYTYLIAGAPAEVHDKIPQAVNLNTWPATFFVGRDGRVKAIHAGFAAPASGDFYRQLNHEYRTTIESLLAENEYSEGIK